MKKILFLSILFQTILFSTTQAQNNPFITRWDLSKSIGSGSTQISFGVATAGTVSYSWQEVAPGTASGSGTFSGSTIATITGLPTGKIIDLSINPTNFQRFYTSNTGGEDRERLIDVKQWGDVAWISMGLAFYYCQNLNISATDIPNLTGVTSMVAMFQYCYNLNGPSNINSWNTSNVINMGAMFNLAIVFNQNIGNWNVSKVTNMYGMFDGAVVFNQNIGNWNVSNVTNMGAMFWGATVFNQNIGNWNVAKVTNMLYMFAGTSVFNQNISNWNTSKVTSMYAMFGGNTTFNQNISNWNVSSVTDMNYMFSDASAFNQNLAAWGTKLNAVVDLANFLNNCGMSTANYDATLTGFNAGTVKGRNMGAFGRTYCASTTDRANLVLPVANGGKGWTITGDNLCAPTASAQSYCQGKTIADLVATGIAIKWYNVATGGTVLASNTILATGTYYASQTVNGIESLRTAVSVTVNLTKTPLLSISPTIVCEGATQTITSLSTNGGISPSYTWTKNGISLTTTQNISISNAVLGDSYSITMAPSADACANSATITASLTIGVGCISTLTSIISGNWENASTWNFNRIPTATDTVIIDANHNVTINTNNANAKKVETRNNAKIIYNNATRLKLGF